MHIIEGKKINKEHKDGGRVKNILNNIDINILQGESVAIMGKSGAGKSTLLHQLSALDKPTSGQVLVEGKDVHALDEESLVRFRLYTFGYVFQDYALIKDLSAIENVQLPLLMKGLSWDDANTSAALALNSVDLADKHNSKPPQLSGGEQQRVSIARAIAGKPQILFADEPTANLDSASGKAVIELFNSLHQEGQTIVMVTHEKEYTHWCDRVISLEDGVIVSDVRNGALSHQLGTSHQEDDALAVKRREDALFF